MEEPRRLRVLNTPEQLGVLARPPMVAIGFFDGIHLGHQAILTRLVERARRQQRLPTVLTFAPHPQKVISPGDAPELLLHPTQKRELLAAAGIEVMLELPFTRKLSMYSPAEFASRYLEPLGAEEIHVGRDFRFGHRRSGDFDELRRLGEAMGFNVIPTAEVMLRGSRISSTRIRKALREGRVELARRMLGRPYQLMGHVVRGDQRGAGIGFPTANLSSRNELTPLKGVYATRVRVGAGRYAGATNIGVRPTFDRAASRPLIETHLLDFEGDLYGQALRIDFCLRLRSERPFDSVDELKAQIGRDVERIRRYAGTVAALTGEAR